MRALALCLASLLLAAGGPARAAEARIAVAGNFAAPAEAIAQGFKAATGHGATLSLGSSGELYAQAVNGAPFDVLLAADIDRPRRAEREGAGVAGTRFTYAVGRLVLYSRTPGLMDQGPAILARGRFNKLALADPALAPYGIAALDTLRSLGVFDRVRPRFVMGASITQTYQFVATGAADLGFVALSQVIHVKGGSRWLVPAQHHKPVEQQAVLLTHGRDNAAAKAFLAYLKTPAAKAVIRRYGYEAP